MTIHPDTHERVTKLQKDVEEIKEELEDQWHEKRETYEDRVRKALNNSNHATSLYLEIDGLRSLIEIEKDLVAQQKRIPTMSLWRAAKKLLKAGLIKKTGVKGKSPIYAKKPWAKALDIEDYVRTKIIQQEKPSD
jgi:chromosome condensin MukBEF ATPase and DNA-binding subunit MukB